MANFVVVSETSLRPDPDDTSQEVVGLKVNDTVAGLHQLATWEKVSFTDSTGHTFLGWVHVDALKEVQASQFKLYNEPLGHDYRDCGVIRGKACPFSLEKGAVAAAGRIDRRGLAQ